MQPKESKLEWAKVNLYGKVKRLSNPPRDLTEFSEQIKEHFSTELGHLQFFSDWDSIFTKLVTKDDQFGIQWELSSMDVSKSQAEFAQGIPLTHSDQLGEIFLMHSISQKSAIPRFSIMLSEANIKQLQSQSLALSQVLVSSTCEQPILFQESKSEYKTESNNSTTVQKISQGDDDEAEEALQLSYEIDEFIEDQVNSDRSQEADSASETSSDSDCEEVDIKIMDSIKLALRKIIDTQAKQFIESFKGEKSDTEKLVAQSQILKQSIVQGGDAGRKQNFDSVLEEVKYEEGKDGQYLKIQCPLEMQAYFMVDRKSSGSSSGSSNESDQNSQNSQEQLSQPNNMKSMLNKFMKSVIKQSTSTLQHSVQLFDDSNGSSDSSLIKMLSSNEVLQVVNCQVEPKALQNWINFQWRFHNPTDLTVSQKLSIQPIFSLPESQVKAVLPYEFHFNPGQSKILNIELKLPSDLKDDYFIQMFKFKNSKGQFVGSQTLVAYVRIISSSGHQQPSSDEQLKAQQDPNVNFKLLKDQLTEEQMCNMASIIQDEGYGDFERCFNVVKCMSGDIDKAREALSNLMIREAQIC